jgi:hypothetical protein
VVSSTAREFNFDELKIERAASELRSSEPATWELYQHLLKRQEENHGKP